MLAIIGIVVTLAGLLTPPSANSPTETTPPPPPDTVIHYTAVGDLNINDTTVGNGDYTKVFQDIAHLLADADISSVNFEGSFE